MSLLLLLIAASAGLANPFQAGTNAQLNKQLGQPVWATGTVYLTGLATLLLLQAFLRQPVPADKVAGASWWAWCGGPISIISTIIALTIAQRMGSGLYTGVSLTASLVTSVALDHFGLLGFKPHAASPARMAGCALMIGGLWLVARF